VSLLDPISHALAAVVATTHDGLTALGADPDSGATWVLCIAAVVVVVRTLVLPIAVHGVRLAHANARARPHLAELQKRFKERSGDPKAAKEFMEERRRITEEHGVSRWGCLPLLVQIPVWIALYHLLANLARGQQVGLMDAGQVASLRQATIAGVPLADTGYLGEGGAHLAVVAGLAATAALLSYVTQRWLVRQNTVLTDAPEVMVTVQNTMPLVSAGGMLLAGGVVPVALLVYWVCSQVWTMAQSAVVWRWYPTPGSHAAERLEARTAAKA
jgi:YidC/Oxa1 family membrane protein insertase